MELIRQTATVRHLNPAAVGQRRAPKRKTKQRDFSIAMTGKTMTAQHHQESGESIVPPTRVAMHGFSDVTERARVAALFARARRWERPWEVVSNADEADCLLVAANTPAELANWHGYQQRITKEHLIAYSDRPFEEARWHLRRPDETRPPSPLEFILLLREISDAFAANKAASGWNFIPKPRETDFNWREKLKILFIGSVGSGKTTAISALSEVDIVSTEAKPTDETRFHKPTTTVAMDFGYFTLKDGTRLQVYGSPGQRRFDFMSQILIKNAFGIVVLINNAADDPQAELNYYLDCHGEYLRNGRAVIGITHCDTHRGPSLDNYARLMARRGEFWPILQADARDPGSMRRLVDTLLANTLRYG